MPESRRVCHICEKILEHEKATICLECCRSADIKELYNLAPKCAECRHNLATTEVDSVAYCDEHTPKVGEEEDYAEQRLIINNFYAITKDLVAFYKDYDTAFSKIGQWLRSGFHLTSSNEVETPFVLWISLYFQLWIAQLMGCKDFAGAMKMLEFVTGPDMQEHGLSQECDINICIYKSQCFQHYADFREAKRLLQSLLWDITDAAYFAREATQELSQSDYSQAVHRLSEEIYACGRREKTYLIANELKSAGYVIELTVPDEDFSVMGGMKPTDILPGFPSYDSQKIESLIGPLSEALIGKLPDALIARLEKLHREYSRESTLMEMVAKGESEMLEFKSSVWWDYKKQCWTEVLEKPVAKTVAAFMNSEGGILLIGVKDNGAVIGIEKDLERKNNIDRFERDLRQILDNCLDKVSCAKCVAIEFEPHERSTVCSVNVKPSQKPVYLRDKGTKEFYIRSGNKNEQLNVQDAIDYIQIHWKS